ncbi:MAG: disulfide bond formation protein B [Patescibacteria group bacterium]
MSYLHLLNLVVATSAVILQPLIVVVIVLLCLRVKDNKFLDFIKKHFLLIGFVLSLSASLVSLYYSEIIGFLPCHLCWFQRIFMYPQVFLFGIAYWKKDIQVARYAMPLLIIGTLIAIYHNFIYYFTEYAGPCDASGVSCVQRLVSEFNGYISIPMLSLTVFVGLITLLLVAGLYKKRE